MKNNLFLLFLVTLFNCAAQQDAKQTDNEIMGTWEWKETSGGFAGKLQNPENTNTTIRLEIGANSIKKFVNDTLESTKEYLIVKDQKSIQGAVVDFLKYENGDKQSIYVKENTLILRDPCFDCFQYEYVRKDG